MHDHRAVRPDAGEYAPFYAGYVAGVPDGDVVETLVRSGAEATALLDGLPEAAGDVAYAPGKWTVREVALHCIDAERIFACRALRIARGDRTPLPGWEEKAYAPESGAAGRTLASLAGELRSVRASTVTLFENLPADTWTRRGIANEREVTVRAIAWIGAGHLLHHLRILRERYLAGPQATSG